jgi:hypothetical protein
MHPSLGTPWKLLKIGDKEAPSIEGFGLFHVEPKTKTEHYLILAQIGDEWTISSSTSPLGEGYPYPIEQVENAVKTLDFVQTCMVVAERHPQHYISKQFVLLVFVSPKERISIQQKTEIWSRQINDLIQVEMGTSFKPDKCLFFSLYPKLQKGELDRNLVENQYHSGALFYKQNSSIYRLLNLLKQNIYEKLV